MMSKFLFQTDADILLSLTNTHGEDLVKSLLGEEQFEMLKSCSSGDLNLKKAEDEEAEEAEEAEDT